LALNKLEKGLTLGSPTTVLGRGKKTSIASQQRKAEAIVGEEGGRETEGKRLKKGGGKREVNGGKGEKGGAAKKSPAGPVRL